MSPLVLFNSEIRGALLEGGGSHDLGPRPHKEPQQAREEAYHLDIPTAVICDEGPSQRSGSGLPQTCW